MATSARKMTRMKSFVKKWQSLNAKVAGKMHASAGCMDDDTAKEDDQLRDYTPGALAASMNGGPSTKAPDGFAVVFVGKSRRRYAIHARHTSHPLFKELQHRSETCGVCQSWGPTLDCEVVLFEHLLWMLDSDEAAVANQHESINELAELYMPSDGSSSLMHLLQQQHQEEEY